MTQADTRPALSCFRSLSHVPSQARALGSRDTCLVGEQLKLDLIWWTTAPFFACVVGDRPSAIAVMAAEAEPLLTPPSASSITLSFTIFALLFSINHGATTTTVTLASSFIGEVSGGGANAVLYLVYGISALFFAVPLLGLMSSRKLLFFCMSCMVAYVLSYLIMAYLPTMTPWTPVQRTLRSPSFRA